MQRVLLAAAAAAIFAAGSSPACASGPADWTGFFIGGDVGGGWSQNHWADTFEKKTISTDTGDGFVGGAQFGFDYQFVPRFVVGLEGTFDGGDLQTRVAQNISCNHCGLLDDSENTWSATAAARLGFRATPAFLIYLKGGAAWAGDKYFQTETHHVIPSVSLTRTGYDLGGGFEWVIASRWSLFVEYDYEGFGTDTFDDFADKTAISQNLQTLTAGVNFHF